MEFGVEAGRWNEGLTLLCGIGIRDPGSGLGLGLDLASTLFDLTRLGVPDCTYLPTCLSVCLPAWNRVWNCVAVIVVVVVTITITMTATVTCRGTWNEILDWAGLGWARCLYNLGYNTYLLRKNICIEASMCISNVHA